MKKSLKVFGLALAGLFLSASVFAAGMEGITVGGRGTLGAAIGTSVEDDGDVDSVFPPDVGITGFIKIPVPVKHLSVQAELGITYKSMFLKFNETEYYEDYYAVEKTTDYGYSYTDYEPYLASYKYSYTSDCSWWQIDLPVLITYDFEINDKLTLSPELGPKISFPLGDFDFDGFNGSIDSHVLFGIDFGCGLYYKAGPGAIVGDLRYDLGLTKLKVEGEDIMTPRALTFSIGYSYTF